MEHLPNSGSLYMNLGVGCTESMYMWAAHCFSMFGVSDVLAKRMI